MASSSTVSTHKRFTYDVFLSFGGKDTRTNFIDHLYHALQQRNIYTYKDDEAIRKGKKISDELSGAIEDSKFYIIVFSKNYASSSWCLDELLKIMECHNTTDHTAYPVFYDVEPTEVRKQSGAVGEAFAKHENDEAAGKWKEALREAADLAGWELKNTANGHEAKFLQRIVEEISLQPSIDFNADEQLVGMETRVKDVVLSLETCTDDVHIIGIKGMGGGGKTTLARAVFDRISFQFEGNIFVENVREVSKASSSGLTSLQQKVLSHVLNQKMKVSSVHDGKNMMKKMMRGRKVLVVLDDVDHIEQLKALAGGPNWFKPGSTVIITTRDEQVLIAHRVKLIFSVNLLSLEEAICLFNRYAFEREILTEGYRELSGKVVRYAAGLPLTIIVLGSFLCGKNKSEWTDAVERLKTIPLEETLKKLELSYHGLEEDYKEIFLNLACILKGWSKDLAIQALESCGFYAINGLRVLQQKSLITISHDYECGYERVGMHDHIEEMGINIVRRLHPDSRLWIDEEIKHILANDLGTKATRYIRFCVGNVNSEIFIQGLGKMTELRFLHVLPDLTDNLVIERKYDNNEYFPNALQYLYWFQYPFWSLPNTFEGNNLVALEMVQSKIEQLWEGEERKVLNKLKFLDLSYSKLTTLDLGLIPNLEALSLRGCCDLVQIHTPFRCLKLICIDLSYSNLKTVDLRSAVNLERLLLINCHALEELQLPDGCLKLIYLNCKSSKLRALDIGSAPNLERLNLDACNDLVELNMPGQCLNLISVDLSHSKLKILDLHSAVNLERLHLKACYALVELHLRDGCQKLTYFDCSWSKLRALDIRLALNLEMLILDECHDLVELNMPRKCLNLRSLELTNSKLRTLDIGLTPNLKYLNLKNCYDLEDLHMADKCQKLVSLIITHSKLRTLDVGLTPNLEKLDLKQCTNLVQLHVPTGCLENLVCLDLSGCLRFTSFLFEKKDETFCSEDESLEFGPLAELDLTAESLRRCPLHPDSNLPKFQFECFYKDNLPSLTRNLESLISVGLCACTNLETFSRSICGVHRLGTLKLKGHLEAPKDLDRLESLAYLKLSHTMTVPDSICMIKHLKSLELDACMVLKKLPEDLGQLESLEKLKLSFIGIEHLPDSICMLKHLKSLRLSYCWLLEKLPEDLGRLECLEELSLSHDKIKHLPDSICMLKHLKSLKLCNCTLIEKLPVDLGRLECLEKLTLSSMKIKYLPHSICMLKHLKSLELSNCWLLEKLPEDLGRLECLEELSLSCEKIKHLPDSICMLKHLKSLELHDCRLLERLLEKSPKDLGRLKCLEELILSCEKIKHFPDSICMLKHLKSLELRYCRLLEKLPEDLGQLECLEKLTLSSTKIKHLPDSICILKHLKSLDLRFSKLLEKLPEDLGGLECLEELSLSYTKIKNIPDSICMLKRLKSLELSNCKLFEKLPEDLGRLDCLEELSLSYTKIKQLPDSITMLKRLKSLDLRFSKLPEKLPSDLGRLECLEKLTLSGTKIKRLPDSIILLKHLKSLELWLCKLLERLPEDLGRLESLEKLNLLDTKIKQLPDSFCMLKHLKSLELNACMALEKLPEDLGRLECLEELSLSCKKIKHLPDSICMLKHLKSLKLKDCELLEKLPEDLGRLDCLEKLSLSCEKIKHLPDSICMLKLLKSLDLNGCRLLEKLPEDLDGFKSLEDLNLRKCKLLGDIPDSICKMNCLNRLDIDGTCIHRLPQDICLLKGLRITGPRELLESCGFTSNIRTIRESCLVVL